MPKRIVPLSDVKILKAKPLEKNYTMFDGYGLFIVITPPGGKLWRFKYVFDGKPQLLALGSYPEVSLQQARYQREEARKQLAAGLNPGDIKKARKLAAEGDNFKTVAKEWFNIFSDGWTEKYANKISQCFENNIFPLIPEKRPIAELKPRDILEVLRFAERRGVLDTAHRVRALCGQVFRYAVATDRAERDITQDLRGALPKTMVNHFAAVTDPRAAAALLRAIDGYDGSFVVQSALKLAPLFFVRPIELRTGEWAEVNFREALWIIPREKMKMRKISDNDHVVPLCTQAITILKELVKLTGSGRYMFPAAIGKDRPMSENAILTALRRMGYEESEMTGHGFRAMARTMLDEVLHFRPDIIEHQLAHAVRDPNGRAYNRTTHLPERREMMQRWADYLDEIKKAGQVLQITPA
ncbi:MAG: integrase arm-type DNA-binding domain-containing protein [Smithella sp.]